MLVCEVPAAMVALVATVVSEFFLCGHFVLTQIVSSMLASTSGNPAGINPVTSQQTHTLTCTMVTSKLSVTSKRVVVLGFII